ncbi:MAG: hypothetical protein M0D57_03130 [Sphingobacteriales bacterium JAD_PAG50586_3]|nr:MAG: hypothetical protein M0D57_03130 [Sphingobacteriales bacterium JAD_PAG50586_3]
MGEPRNNNNYSLRGLLYFVQDKEARRVTIITVTAALCLTFCQYFAVTKYGNFFLMNIPRV